MLTHVVLRTYQNTPEGRLALVSGVIGTEIVLPLSTREGTITYRVIAAPETRVPALSVVRTDDPNLARSVGGYLSLWHFYGSQGSAIRNVVFQSVLDVAGGEIEQVRGGGLIPRDPLMVQSIAAELRAHAGIRDMPARAEMGQAHVKDVMKENVLQDTVRGKCAYFAPYEVRGILHLMLIVVESGHPLFTLYDEVWRDMKLITFPSSALHTARATMVRRPQVREVVRHLSAHDGERVQTPLVACVRRAA